MSDTEKPETPAEPTAAEIARERARQALRRSKPKPKRQWGKR